MANVKEIGMGTARRKFILELEKFILGLFEEQIELTTSYIKNAIKTRPKRSDKVVTAYNKWVAHCRLNSTPYDGYRINAERYLKNEKVGLIGWGLLDYERLLRGLKKLVNQGSFLAEKRSNKYYFRLV